MKKNDISEVDTHHRPYDHLTENARFREQYRFVFSATIIATYFVSPSGNALELLLKVILGVATFFAALYLICTAATVKYRSSRWMYEVFYVSERLRIRMYDVAIDVFAAGLLYFLSLLGVGLFEKTFQIKLGEIGDWISVVVGVLVIGLVVSLFTKIFRRYYVKKDSDLERLI